LGFFWFFVIKRYFWSGRCQVLPLLTSKIKIQVLPSKTPPKKCLFPNRLALAKNILIKKIKKNKIFFYLKTFLSFFPPEKNTPFFGLLQVKFYF
jgi:hypothetical protein